MQDYYIRTQGKIFGPFSLSKLQEAAKSGKLSKAHEISMDRVEWKLPSDVSELSFAQLSTSPVGDLPEKRASPAPRVAPTDPFREPARARETSLGQPSPVVPPTEHKQMKVDRPFGFVSIVTRPNYLIIKWAAVAIAASSVLWLVLTGIALVHIYGIAGGESDSLREQLLMWQAIFDFAMCAASLLAAGMLNAYRDTAMLIAQRLGSKPNHAAP